MIDEESELIKTRREKLTEIRRFGQNPEEYKRIFKELLGIPESGPIITLEKSDGRKRL